MAIWIVLFNALYSEGAQRFQYLGNYNWLVSVVIWANLSANSKKNGKKGFRKMDA